RLDKEAKTHHRGDGIAGKTEKKRTILQSREQAGLAGADGGFVKKYIGAERLQPLGDEVGGSHGNGARREHDVVIPGENLLHASSEIVYVISNDAVKLKVGAKRWDRRGKIGRAAVPNLTGLQGRVGRHQLASGGDQGDAGLAPDGHA